MQNRSAPLLPELLTVRSFDYLHMCIIFPKNVRTLNAELAKLIDHAYYYLAATFM